MVSFVEQIHTCKTTMNKYMNLSLLFRLGRPGLTFQARVRLCTRPCETENCVKPRNLPLTCECNDQSDDALCIVVLGGFGRGAPQF